MFFTFFTVVLPAGVVPSALPTFFAVTSAPPTTACLVVLATFPTGFVVLATPATEPVVALPDAAVELADPDVAGIVTLLADGALVVGFAA